jgi:Metal-dependent hydrolases of the beta-lactamase superfamily II
MLCTVLVENTSDSSALLPQHGLSLYIETDGAVLLLDAGQDDAFAKNAAVLGKDLISVSAAVCSHAHYDHAGGFAAFCSINRTAPVYTYWRAGTVCYSTSRAVPGSEPVCIGWSGTDPYSSRIRSVDSSRPLELFPGIMLVPVVVHSASRPYKNRTLFVRKDGTYIPDDFSHECVLAVSTEKAGRRGLALFNSCSHNGVVNSIESVHTFFPGADILSYTGGFHFPWGRDETPVPEDMSAMDELASRTAALGTELYTGHCTGPAACTYLSAVCGQRLHTLHTGMSFIL